MLIHDCFQTTNCSTKKDSILVLFVSVRFENIFVYIPRHHNHRLVQPTVRIDDCRSMKHDKWFSFAKMEWVRKLSNDNHMKAFDGNMSVDVENLWAGCQRNTSWYLWALGLCCEPPQTSFATRHIYNKKRTSTSKKKIKEKLFLRTHIHEEILLSGLMEIFVDVPHEAGESLWI